MFKGLKSFLDDYVFADPKELGSSEARQACMRSLEKLQSEYIDLLLIHWPAKQKLKPQDTAHAQYRKDTWREMEKLYDEGIIINYTKENKHGCT